MINMIKNQERWSIKATKGGLEARLHQADEHCAIGAMTSKCYGNILWWSHLPPSVISWRRPPYIPIGLWWNFCNDTMFVRLGEMSFTDPWGGLKGTRGGGKSRVPEVVAVIKVSWCTAKMWQISLNSPMMGTWGDQWGIVPWGCKGPMWKHMKASMQKGPLWHSLSP